MKKLKNKSVKISAVFLVILIASFILIIARFGQIALMEEVDGINIATFAKNRNTTTKKLYASRGTIYDSTNEVLAQSVNAYTVIAYLRPSRTTDENNPKHVVDKEMTAKKLAEVFEKNGITNMPYEHILELLNKDPKDYYQVELRPGGKDIMEATKSEIEALELPGIDFIQGTKRYYKLATLAPYIVGYARENDEGKIVGEMGVEKYFNDDLEGVDGTRTYETDIYGFKLPNSPEKVKDPEQGKDIYLTIDSNIQMIMERAVRSLVDDYQMSWITFTIADAKTGAILGTASNPTFDLNKLVIESYLDPLVSYQYEPGSTMKIFSFMAAMENGVYDGNKKYQSGNIKIGDTTIYDFNNDGWGMITFDEGFANSSNTAASYLSKALGREKLHDFYEKLGFGEPTGITLPGEVSGDISFIYDTEVATAAFGQGITTTPIQTIQGLTVVSNDGVMLKPYIVDKIVDSKTGKVTYQGGKEEVRQVASKETTDKMKELMHKAVYEGKTNAHYFTTKNIDMLGKTGTANIASPNGGYLKGKYDYINSFAGIFPANDPKYIIYISAKQFVGSSNQLARAVREVIDEVAKYKNIYKEDNAVVESEIVVLDNYINTLTDETKEKLSNAKLNPIIIGDGKYVVEQFPKKGSKLLTTNKVFLKTTSNNILMPDITGWSENEAVTFCNLVGLSYTISGYGNVKNFSIPANTLIDYTTPINIELENGN